MMPVRKRSEIKIRVGNRSFCLPYRTLTNGSFSKNKTKKYCLNTPQLSFASNTFYLNPGSGNIVDALDPCDILAVKITLASSYTKDFSMLYRVSSNAETRGLVFTKGQAYKISLVSQSALPDVDVSTHARSNSVDEPLFVSCLSSSPPSSSPSSPRSPSPSLYESSPCFSDSELSSNEVVRTLSPVRRDPHAAREWLAYHNFSDTVQASLKEFTESDLCGLTKDDCKCLLPPKDAIRLHNLLSREMPGLNNVWASQQ